MSTEVVTAVVGGLSGIVGTVMATVAVIAKERSKTATAQSEAEAAKAQASATQAASADDRAEADANLSLKGFESLVARQSEELARAAEREARAQDRNEALVHRLDEVEDELRAVKRAQTDNENKLSERLAYTEAQLVMALGWIHGLMQQVVDSGGTPVTPPPGLNLEAPLHV